MKPLDVIKGMYELVPEALRTNILDKLVNSAADIAAKGGVQNAAELRKLTSEGSFLIAFEQAWGEGIKRFIEEYRMKEEDIVDAITSDTNFWNSPTVQQALMNMVKRPTADMEEEKATVAQHFQDVLPTRINRGRVEDAIKFLLRCIVEALWTIPAAKEIRELYLFLFNKVEAENSMRQTELLTKIAYYSEQQVSSFNEFSDDVREVLSRVVATIDQKLLSAANNADQMQKPKPLHNLPAPTYSDFVGREKEKKELKQLLSRNDRAWQIVITGIGGVGKSALATYIGYFYNDNYGEMPEDERYEAIIWVSAKEESYTVIGKESIALPGLVLRNLDNIYDAVAQTLTQELIKSATTNEQRTQIIQQVLREHRTLLIIDNMETVTDKLVKTFLRNLPPPTKAIITSRELLDEAAEIKLTGLPVEEARQMILVETKKRGLKLKATETYNLYERTSGLPLPIKIAVGRIASGESFSQVMRWLGDTKSDLVKYCIEGQIELVRPKKDINAWKLLIACSFLDDEVGSSRQVLGQIADLSDVDCEEGITRLYRLSLFDRRDYSPFDANGDYRYYMPQLVYEYIKSQRKNTELESQAVERWLNWALSFKTQTNNYESQIKLIVEYPNLIEVVRWCKEHQRWQTLLQIAEVIMFQRHGLSSISINEVLGAAIEAFAALGKAAAGEYSEHWLVQFTELVRIRYDRAISFLKTTEEELDQQSARADISAAPRIQARARMCKSFMQDAEHLAKAELELGEQLAVDELQSEATNRLAEIDSKRQKLEDLTDKANQAMRRYELLRQAKGNYEKGTNQVRKGNFSPAEQLLTQSLEQASAIEEDGLIADIKDKLAHIYASTNRYRLALRTAKEAYTIYEDLHKDKQKRNMNVFINELRVKNEEI